MHEYPISSDYADAAVQSIYAGTNEIMKVIIARRMGLGLSSSRRVGRAAGVPRRRRGARPTPPMAP